MNRKKLTIIIISALAVAALAIALVLSGRKDETPVTGQASESVTGSVEQTPEALPGSSQVQPGEPAASTGRDDVVTDASWGEDEAEATALAEPASSGRTSSQATQTPTQRAPETPSAEPTQPAEQPSSEQPPVPEPSSDEPSSSDVPSSSEDAENTTDPEGWGPVLFP